MIALFWILCLPATTFVLVRAVLPFRAVTLFGVDFYIVSDTKSMEPLFEHNDLIAVKKYNFGLVDAGDIICFVSTAEIQGQERRIVVTHKVIETVKNADGVTESLKTQGVNPETGEDITPVTIDGADGSNLYLGKYFYRNALLGRVIAFLSGSYGLAVILFDCVCLILIDILRPHEANLLLGENI